MSHDYQSEQADTTAVVSVLVSNHRRFLAFLERRVGNRALAEDILQDAFARGINKASTLRDDESAVSWFYRLLRNAVIDHARRKGTANKALEPRPSKTFTAQSAAAFRSSQKH